MADGRLVYSTDGGDRRRRREREPAAAPGGDGIARVSREKTGRRGKTVTIVRGLPAAEVAAVAADLKKQCGAGGAVKDGTVEIQGDHRDKVAARLQARGHVVKIAGG
ncbi:MAG TPA: hypothetical protein VGK79_14125 [Gaiellaceae bacterium]